MTQRSPRTLAPILVVGLLAALLGLAAPAVATPQEVTVNPTAVGRLIATCDGANREVIEEPIDVDVWNGCGSEVAVEYRGGIEYDLGGLPAGTIQSARLRLTGRIGSLATISVYAYAGDGSITTDDWDRTADLAGVMAFDSNGTGTLDVTSAVQANRGGTIGFLLVDTHGAGWETATIPRTGIEALTVTVADTTAPSITCPSAYTTTLTAGGNVTIGAAEAGVVAGDDVALADVSLFPNNFSAPGSFDVVATATDTSGNQSSCGFTVTVRPLDRDGDGIADPDDPFPDSNQDPTVVIDGADTGVANQAIGDGSTFADRIGACEDGAADHSSFVACVDGLTDAWVADGLIAGRDGGRIMRAAGRSTIAR